MHSCWGGYHILIDIITEIKLKHSSIFQAFFLYSILSTFTSVIVNELVHIRDHGGDLYVHEYEAWDDLRLQSRVRPRSRSQVNVELVLMLVSFEMVCVASGQNVTVQLPE